MCAIGHHFSGYSGEGGGDFIAVAQGYKPSINIYQWGKAQIHLQCHLQEIVNYHLNNIYNTNRIKVYLHCIRF